ncbi:hypothetical protein [Wenxinia saemankumensis]|uniref:hypothetical protein n=1 Tax=Wenxinia saemankumensis TaxID=1447782 RepID=UPI0011154342|nr:hypothetical protein [Wenxinia saemankumensis]
MLKTGTAMKAVFCTLACAAPAKADDLIDFGEDGVRTSCEARFGPDEGYVDTCMDSQREHYRAVRRVWLLEGDMAREAAQRCVDDDWPRWHLIQRCTGNQVTALVGLRRWADEDSTRRYLIIGHCAAESPADIVAIERCARGAAAALGDRQ